MSQTRRLAAILAADVAGYSRLIGADEGGTLERLKALRRELLDPKIAEHKGRLVKTTGDGLLVEFGSVVDALRCGVEVQREMAGRSAGVPPDSRIELRIGINVGDIVVEDGDIFGDGVNVTARLEALAEPGGICVAARVQEDAAGKLDLAFEDLGEQQLKNIARPVRAYRVVIATSPAATRPGTGPPLPDKPSIAVLPFANMSGDPGILTNAALVLAYFGEDIGAMMALADRALRLNPNYARGWHTSGTLRLFAGQPDLAIEHVDAALRLSPRARIGSLTTIGAAHFVSRRFTEAVPKLLLAIQEDPSLPNSYRFLAACYAHMRRLDDTRDILARLKTITPVVVPSIVPFRDPEHRELYLSGLRLAAGETT